jgi:hypothetical protein
MGRAELKTIFRSRVSLTDSRARAQTGGEKQKPKCCPHRSGGTLIRNRTFSK